MKFLNLTFIFRRKPKIEVSLPPVEVHISPFNNLWNQLSLELARPKLYPGATIDQEKVRLLREQLAAFK